MIDRSTFLNGIRVLIATICPAITAAHQKSPRKIGNEDLEGTVEYKTSCESNETSEADCIRILRAVSGFKMATRTTLVTNNVHNNALAYDAAHREPHLHKHGNGSCLCYQMLSSLPLLTGTHTLLGFLEMAYRSALADGGTDSCISSAARH